MTDDTNRVQEAIENLKIMLTGAEDCLRLKQSEAMKGHDWVVTNQVYPAQTIISLLPLITAAQESENLKYMLEANPQGIRTIKGEE